MTRMPQALARTTLRAAALAAVLFAAPAQADFHQLIYFPPEGVDVLVDHAPNAPWCADEVRMRVVQFGVPAQPLLPRIMYAAARELEKQCPQAARMRWARSDSLGKLTQSGTAARDEGWRMENVAPVADDVPPVPYQMSGGAKWHSTEARVRREQASAARQQLAEYRGLQHVADTRPEMLLTQAQVLPHLESLAGGDYGNMLKGKSLRVHQIVRVAAADGRTDTPGGATETPIDWPYEMRVVGQPALAPGWYVIEARMRVDPARRDPQDLPLTLLTPEPTPPHACRAPGCAEIDTPIAVMRIMLGQPEWTPAHAETLIQQAQAPLPTPPAP